MRRSPGNTVSLTCSGKNQHLHHFALITLLLLATLLNTAYAASHPFYITAEQTADYQLKQIGYQYEWIDSNRTLAEEAFDDDEPHMARRIWVALAEQGQPDAAYKLGMVYDSGIGVERDPARAAYWYRRAAEDGHLHAQHNLAVAYANGDGVELNFNKALNWWKRSAAAGNADSQYNLGIVYAMGVHGVKRNIDMAKKWWRKAAIKGDAMAQYNLGTIYVNGEDEVTSYCEAMRWWEKSAEKGVQQASWALEVIKSRRDYQSCW